MRNSFAPSGTNPCNAGSRRGALNNGYQVDSRILSSDPKKGPGDVVSPCHVARLISRSAPSPAQFSLSLSLCVSTRRTPLTAGRDSSVALRLCRESLTHQEIRWPPRVPLQQAGNGAEVKIPQRQTMTVASRSLCLSPLGTRG